MLSKRFVPLALIVASLIAAGLGPLALSAPAKAAPLQQSAMKVGQVFATIYVPRYGKSYKHLVAEGTSLPKVLNKVGIGHYTGTQLPGEVGNFAIAGHRFGNGGPMLKIDKLRTGDRVYVKTSTTWYTYEWLQTKVVKPSAIGSIYPVPEGLKYPVESGKYLTFTSCTPVHVNTHRIIAWFGYISEQPVADGMPADLAEVYVPK